MHCGEVLLDLGNGLSRVQVLGACLGTVHDGVATVQFLSVVECGQALGFVVITGVVDPAESLHQNFTKTGQRVDRGKGRR